MCFCCWCVGWAVVYWTRDRAVGFDGSKILPVGRRRSTIAADGQLLGAVDSGGADFVEANFTVEEWAWYLVGARVVEATARQVVGPWQRFRRQQGIHFFRCEAVLVYPHVVAAVVIPTWASVVNGRHPR